MSSSNANSPRRELHDGLPTTPPPPPELPPARTRESARMDAMETQMSNVIRHLTDLTTAIATRGLGPGGGGAAGTESFEGGDDSGGPSSRERYTFMPSSEDGIPPPYERSSRAHASYRRDRGYSLPAKLALDSLKGAALAKAVLDWCREAQTYERLLRREYSEEPIPDQHLTAKLMTTLTGVARAWGDQRALTHPLDSVSDLVKAIREEYEATPESEGELWTDLASLRLERNDLPGYLRTFDRDLNRILMMTQYETAVVMEKARERLLRSIPGDCTRELRHTVCRAGDHHRSLDEVPYHDLLKSLKQYSKARSNEERLPRPLNRGAAPIRRLNAVGSVPNRGNPPNTFTGKCWNCQEVGHRASDCPSAQRQARRLNAILAGDYDDAESTANDLADDADAAQEPDEQEAPVDDDEPSDEEGDVYE